jgi:hypothetical protein
MTIFISHPLYVSYFSSSQFETGGATRLVVSDGSKVKFWHDIWCEDQALKIAFQDLYRIAHFKEVAVADHLELFRASVSSMTY